MTTKFNQAKSIQSNLSSEQERGEKIQEMIARGFYVVRTYEYEKSQSVFLNGKHGPKHTGIEGRKVYGVFFRRVE